MHFRAKCDKNAMLKPLDLFSCILGLNLMKIQGLGLSLKIFLMPFKKKFDNNAKSILKQNLIKNTRLIKPYDSFEHFKSKFDKNARLKKPYDFQCILQENVITMQ